MEYNTNFNGELTVKKLKKILEKLPDNMKIGQQVDRMKFDYDFIPFLEAFNKFDVELIEDLRSKGKKVFADYLILS